MRQQRLRKYWEAKGFRNGKAFADYLDLSPSHFSELDKREHPARLLLALTQKTDLNTSWLLTGTGDMISTFPPATVEETAPDYQPKQTIIPLHAVDEWGNVLPMGSTRLQPYCDFGRHGLYAVTVTGTAMSPMYVPGSIVVASPEVACMNGNPVIASLSDGRRLVRIYRPKGDLVILEAVNPAVEPLLCSSSDIACLHRIIWKREPE